MPCYVLFHYSMRTHYLLGFRKLSLIVSFMIIQYLYFAVHKRPLLPSMVVFILNLFSCDKNCYLNFLYLCLPENGPQCCRSLLWSRGNVDASLGGSGFDSRSGQFSWLRVFLEFFLNCKTIVRKTYATAIRGNHWPS